MGMIFCVEFQHKIFYPYIEICRFYSQVKIQELWDLRAHPPPPHPPLTPLIPLIPPLTPNLHPTTR